MPPTPSQIKELLLTAIDKDDNIVDMGSVTKAVTLLEGNPITKDALEETRLGKIINLIRKKTSNSAIKKRCAALIRQWQSQFLQKTPQPPKSESPAPSQDDRKGQEGLSTTDGQKSKPPKQTTNTLPVDKSKSENQRRRKREAESSPSISPSSRGPPQKKLSSSQGRSPSLVGEGNGQDDSSLNGMSVKEERVRVKTLIKDEVQPSSPRSRVSSPSPKPGSSKEKGSLKRLKQERSSSPKERTKNVATNSLSPGTSRKHVLVKKEEKVSPVVSSAKTDRKPHVSPGASNQSPAKRSKTAANAKSPRQSHNASLSNSPPAKARSSVMEVPSVFGMDWETNFSSVGNEVDSQAPSQSLSIFDLDSSERLSQSVSPGGIFEMGRAPSPPVEEDYPMVPAASVETSAAEDELETRETESPESPSAGFSGPVARMETLEDDPVTPPAPVPEGDIDRIHNEHWEGVNGCYNNKGEWSDWMQCVVVNTEEDTSLQILPYVCID
ncbi:uncharacterized protein [Diadema setosum]|uniref:uncharacterized protein n=1 Tax=Diadema setosum TaxID=31175 RepID=UPI003B3BC7D3